ncbi:MAG: putative thiamine pyrophosphate-dependent decarboxylase [Modestobacter sp.]|nr:putative thiamine pyrophosphate-dependent decarboxylase [Modestobacter sp.]
MNGAQAVIRTLVAGGVDVCFANPGTSEMHFVAALDDVPEMRAVLTLFEGVATGAADGYARMAGRPAATLLHLGPGLGNGVANLHNASRAGVPLVDVVGDHALAHKRLDAPLESDIDAIAGAVSGWVRRSLATAAVGEDAADAVAAAQVAPGQVATLVLPADVSWSDGAEVAEVPDRRPAALVPPAALDEVAGVLGESTVLFLAGDAVTEEGLLAAAQVAAGTGARLIASTFPTRMARGAGVPDVPRLSYPPQAAMQELAGTEHLVLVGAKEPVAFFAYPDLPGRLAPVGCAVHALSRPDEDGVAALRELAERVAPDAVPAVAALRRPPLPTGALTPATMAAVVGALLPEGAIVVDEALTSGTHLHAATAGAPRHDWLTLTGGAIGAGLPLATGAAVACPDRPVVSLQADGSAMYTVQALWTQAREQLDVTTVICDNGAYAILEGELQNVGARSGGERAGRLLDLGSPDLDFVALATGMGVPATRATSAEELAEQFAAALAEPGPHLIDAVLRPAD